MLWVIDGYNVIRRDPDLRLREAESLEAGRRALVHLVIQAARTLPRDEFVIVFDGARIGDAAPPRGRVRIVFSRPPETADDVVRRLGSVAGSVVVSSDRAVQHAARRARAAVVDAETFVARAARAVERAALDSPGAPRDDDAADRPSTKRGNPRRLSKKARAAARVMKRLR